jgi:hypothetical protein
MALGSRALPLTVLVFSVGAVQHERTAPIRQRSCARFFNDVAAVPPVCTLNVSEYS